MKKSLTLALALAVAGFAGAANAQVTVVNADVTADTTWTGTVILDAPIFVTSGATLTILPGTIVRGQPRSAAVVPGSTVGTPGTLTVTQDGRIVASGTASAPIIFTTAAVDNDLDGIPDDSTPADPFLDAWTPGADTIPGTADDDLFLDDTPATAPLAPLDPSGDSNDQMWGGLVLNGHAPTNLSGVSGVGTGQGIVEGLTVPGFPAAFATYGGGEPHDSSGILRYVSIRHGGDEIGDSNELNGLTLAGVGDGTIVEFVEVYANYDDGIEWFGGTVNGNNLHTLFVGDDNFDTDQGYTGVNQFLFSVGAYFGIGSADGDKIIEGDGNDGGVITCGDETVSSLVPIPALADARPCPLEQSFFWNLTGLAGNMSALQTNSDNEGLRLRNGFGGLIANSIIANTDTVASIDVRAGGAPTGWSSADQVCSDTQTVSTNPAPAGTGDLLRVATTTFNDGPAIPDGGAGCQGDETDALQNGNDYADGLSPLPAILIDNSITVGAALVSEDVDIDLDGDAGYGLTPAAEVGAALNPKPAGATFGINPEGNPSALDSDATYRGAFDPSLPGTWLDGWSVLGISGLL